MSYTLDFAVVLGTSKTGLTLEAQLIDSAGFNVDAPVTTGFTEIGSGSYMWTGTIPDDHQGGVAFREHGTSTNLAFAEVNPVRNDMISLPSTALDNIEIEPGINLRQALAFIGAATAGKLVLTSSNVVTINGMGVPNTRIIANVTHIGERLQVTLLPPS